MRRTPAETVKHVIYPVSDSQKSDLLLELLKRVNYNSVLIFCRTKHGADRIAGLLKRANHAVAVLHSNRTQREREQALEGFRNGKFEALVATDIAARGLDIAEVSHVINYDVPQHPEDYIHRIGRTGRAEHSGDAFTIMTAEDSSHVFAIERFISQKIPRVKLENFDYKYTMLFEEGKPGAAERFPRQSPRRARPWRLPLRARTEKVNESYPTHGIEKDGTVVILLNLAANTMVGFFIFAGVFNGDSGFINIAATLLAAAVVLGIPSGMALKTFRFGEVVASVSPLLFFFLLFIGGSIEKGGPIVVAVSIFAMPLIFEGGAWWLGTLISRIPQK